jgi:hypothetical protein
MSQEQMIDLACRAVACKGWRWMPGTRWWTEDDRGRLDDYQPEYMGRPAEALPDLTDPATLGCLLALVREAWGCAVITSPDYDDDEEGAQGPLVGWRAVETKRWVTVGDGAMEAEALVAALEAAPSPEENP